MFLAAIAKPRAWWPYYTVGRTYKIFYDANFDTAKVRDFEEELRDFSKVGRIHPRAWGSLLPTLYLR